MFNWGNLYDKQFIIFVYNYGTNWGTDAIDSPKNWQNLEYVAKLTLPLKFTYYTILN